VNIKKTIEERTIIIFVESLRCVMLEIPVYLYWTNIDGYRSEFKNIHISSII
jgi:hypothetical protein